MKPFYINPVMLEIGPFKAHWYGLMYAIAFLLGYVYMHHSRLGKRLKLTDEQKDEILLSAILGVLLGGRIGYILFYNLPYYMTEPFKIFAVWEGGMSFHGGLLGVIIALFISIRKHKIHFLQISDIITSIAPLGLFFGRIGNFINAELYGRVTDKFCLYFITDPSNCRYPSQLIQAFLEGFTLFVILMVINKKVKRTGVTTSFFLILYGLFRIIAEFFREPDPQIGFLFGHITEGQLLSFAMIVGGIILLTDISKKHKVSAKKNK